MAYAAAVSFEGTLERLLYYSNRLSPVSLQFIESLHHLANSMQDFDFEEQRPEGESLEMEIRDSVYRAEDIVESYMLVHLFPSEADMIISVPSNFFHFIFIILLEKVMPEMKHSMEKMKKLAHQLKHVREKSFPILLSPPECSSKIVGLDEELRELKRNVLGRTSLRLKAVVIHGMGGIGKTCLAKMFYNDSDVRSQFFIGAWVQISLKHSARDILLSFINTVQRLDQDYLHGRLFSDHSTDEDLTEEQLETCVRALFSVPRYIVVLDCLCEMNSDSWDYIIDLLPDCNNGSRIVLVNRMIFRDSELVFFEHQKRFLELRPSWDLLRERVFGDNEPCPRELRKIGEEIAKNCEGLPLAIITVGIHLARNEKTVEYWNEVARSRNSLAYEADGASMFKQLGLSYKQLTRDFRPLFLYMGVLSVRYMLYPPDIHFLGIAEGLVKASEYLDFDLRVISGWFQQFISRHLLRFNIQDKSVVHLFSFHHTMWHLCCNQAKRDGFFHVVDKYIDGWEDSSVKENIRRLIIRWNTLLSIKDVFKSEHSELLSSVRSLLLTGPFHPYPFPKLLGSYRMLRVLYAYSISFYEFPCEILYLKLLRSLYLLLNGGTVEIPTGISKLRMLQFLTVKVHQIVRSFGEPPTYLPTEIWEMEQLIRLEVMGNALPLPPHSNSLLPNLLDLMSTSPQSCKKEVLERIPNLISLGICVDLEPENKCLHMSPSPFDHLFQLQKLHWLGCEVKYIHFEEYPTQPHVAAMPESVPISMNNLTRLTLIGCGFSWDSMSKQISQLPVLEVLQLQLDAFRGPKWEITNEGFKRLTLLLLEDLDLVYWTGTSGYQFFPRLQTLMIKRCHRLEKISSHFLSCYDLKTIKVQDSSSAVETWAYFIQREVSRIRPQTGGVWLDISSPRIGFSHSSSIVFTSMDNL